MGEEGDVVSPRDESLRKHIDDPLDAAIVKRRHGQFGVGSDGYAQ